MKLYLKGLAPIEELSIRKLLPVTDSTPFLTGSKLPSGVYAPALRYITANKFHSKEARIFKCKYFSLFYFPSNYFLSLFRKTRPALTVSFDNNVNGNPGLLTYPDSTKRIIIQGKSVNPFDYACWRKKVSLEVKKTFLQEWISITSSHQNNDNLNYGESNIIQNSIDGYYTYVMRLYPTNKDINEFRNQVRKSLKEVAELQTTRNQNISKGQKKIKPQSTQWVSDMNNKLNIKKFNNFLKMMDFPYMLIKK